MLEKLLILFLLHSSAKMDNLEKLEHLNLVSKIVIELENHFDLGDKDTAEFIIALAKDNPTFDKFKKALAEQGLDDVSVFLNIFICLARR